VERSAHAILDGLASRPPGNLRELERLVGRLDVDMAGPEGRGGGVFRPESPFAPGGVTGGSRLGDLRPGLVRMFASFDHDPHHGHPRTTEGLRPNQVSVSLDLDRRGVRRALEGAFGPPRSIQREGKPVEEFGRWYYLEPWDRPTSIAWHRERPDWAVPPVPPSSSEAFIAALVRALAGGADADRVAVQLAPLAASAGATITGSGGRVTITARPGLALPAVAAAFGWQEPVAWSTDVHMVRWMVGPKDPGHGGPAPTKIGGWLVEAWLDRAPRDAPTTTARGPSLVYDVRAHQGSVVTLVATEAD
jgi:hypothetical protein